MTEGMPESTYSQLERDLTALYAASAPPDFALRLGKQLQARAEELGVSPQRQTPWWRTISFSRRPALAFALVVLLILAIVVIMVGPRRVLAAVQDLLGYVPGIGFVDLEEARQLANPVTVIRDGVTFQLDRVVAQPDKTLMTFSVHGMPEVGPKDNGPEVEVIMMFEPTLRLPNGEFFNLSAVEYRAHGSDRSGGIEFPAIPAEIDEAWLEFEYLPDAIPGGSPEGWQVPFNLLPVEGELPSESFIPSYFPVNIRTSAQGVTLQILQVARTESEMAVQVRTTWENPDWEYSASWEPVLGDDLGHIYREGTIPPVDPFSDAETLQKELGGTNSGSAISLPASGITTPGPAPHLDQTFVYTGISVAARQWTLSLPELEFGMPADASFQVDLGEKPQLNQTMPVDQWVQVAGMDVHVLAMRLSEEMFPFEEEALEAEYVLEFVMEPVPQAHRWMYMLNIESNADWISGGGAQGGSDLERLNASLKFNRVPTGKIDVRISEAVITIEGPWEVSWEMPPAGIVQSAARYAYPDVVETHNGVTLAVKEAMLSDRMTRVELALPGLPPGAELVSTFPSRSENWVSLEDEWGLRLDPLQEIGTAEIGFNPAELRFASLPARSKKIALTVPEVEIFYPGQASLVIEVPQELQFHEETEQVTETITRTRWVSDPWPLDLSLEIAGYRFHFNQARLERQKGEMEGMYHYRLEVSGETPRAGQDEVQVSSLRVARIDRPDGIVQTFNREVYRLVGYNLPYSTVEPSAPGSTESRLLLEIDVTSPNRLELTTGLYTIDLAGLVLFVPGPWQLSWSFSQ